MKRLTIIASCLLFFSLLSQANQGQIATVKRVVDGDTIVLENDEHVRLLGVDTPELHHPSKPVQCFGKEAKAFTVAKIEGKKVKLEFEGPRKDRYGRTLAWVWYGDKFEHLLNADLIREGYGFSFRKYPTSRLEELNRLEHQAREAGRGLWAPDACKDFGTAPAPGVVVGGQGEWCASKNSNVYHPCTCPAVKSIKPENLIRFMTEEEARASGRRLHQCHK